MKETIRNKKGFTLVELLAVIVVLAIIILVAMPNVLSAMDKARRNTMISEAQEFAKIAQTAYADDEMSGNNTVSASTNGYCYSMKYLIENGYMDKKKNGNDDGSVLLKVNDSGKATYEIWLTNGTYNIAGVEASSLSNKLTSNGGSISSGKGSNMNNCGNGANATGTDSKAMWKCVKGNGGDSGCS